MHPQINSPPLAIFTSVPCGHAMLFVCLGDVFARPRPRACSGTGSPPGIGADVDIESAGTGGWHIGGPPDRRATAAAASRGIALESRAQGFDPSHFDEFDLILAMDRQNLADVRALAPDAAAAGKLRLFREYDPRAVESGDLEVPDPYFGGDEGLRTCST